MRVHIAYRNGLSPSHTANHSPMFIYTSQNRPARGTFDQFYAMPKEEKSWPMSCLEHRSLRSRPLLALLLVTVPLITFRLGTLSSRPFDDADHHEALLELIATGQGPTK